METPFAFLHPWRIAQSPHDIGLGVHNFWMVGWSYARLALGTTVHSAGNVDTRGARTSILAYDHVFCSARFIASRLPTTLAV